MTFPSPLCHYHVKSPDASFYGPKRWKQLACLMSLLLISVILSSPDSFKELYSAVPGHALTSTAPLSPTGIVTKTSSIMRSAGSVTIIHLSGSRASSTTFHDGTPQPSHSGIPTLVSGLALLVALPAAYAGLRLWQQTRQRPALSLQAAAGAVVSADRETEIRPGVFEGYWVWNGHRIRYHRSGTGGPAILFVHGFGANADHWRQNVAPLGNASQTFAVDLLGYGYSDKPTPCKETPNTVYNFERWGRQLVDFIREKIGQPAFVVTNSVGGVAGMQAAIEDQTAVRGVILMNVSLRMLHETKQPPLVRPLVKAFQTTLRTTPLGQYFFENLATPRTLKNVLCQAYSNPDTVTDELVDAMLQPGLQPGAVDVFLDFISYSTGPLPEQQLAKLTCPVRIIWGEDDPWEKLEWGRDFRKFACVEDFITLPGVGHCPHDEAPDQVNPLIEEFVAKHSQAS
eukprot:EG_transcript_8537